MRRVAQVIVLAAILAVALWVWPGVMTRTAGIDEGPTSYRTATITRRDIQSTVLATGVIRPMVGAEVQVGSRVSGVLQTLNVSIGDQVEAAEVLAQLDPAEFQARLDQALAALETAEVEERFAGIDLTRVRELRAREVIAQAELDEVERRYQMAAANLSQAQANERSAQIQLDYTVIRAPVSGVVASVSTQVGETVAASFASPTFVTIIDLDRLEIWAYVDETDIGRVEVGQEARFTVDTYQDTEFRGMVTAIQPQAEIVDNVVNYVTLIEIGSTEGKTLRPEMTTTVNILLDGREDVLTLPNGAVRRDSEGVFAFVPGPDGPVRRAIRTGYRGSDYTEVLEGLVEGDEALVGSVPNGG
ncbi:MAG: efflux RND transporter periplasmic adaptor subunit [Gemmatimonadetes bacterium]|nr:efflux RND transporter periplasmic adaptor subunit [Gemmatimonadota bacterium]